MPAQPSQAVTPLVQPHSIVLDQATQTGNLVEHVRRGGFGGGGRGFSRGGFSRGGFGRGGSMYWRRGGVGRRGWAGGRRWHGGVGPGWGRPGGAAQVGAAQVGAQQAGAVGDLGAVGATVATAATGVAATGVVGRAAMAGAGQFAGEDAFRYTKVLNPAVPRSGTPPSRAKGGGPYISRLHGLTSRPYRRSGRNQPDVPWSRWTPKK